MKKPVKFPWSIYRIASTLIGASPVLILLMITTRLIYFDTLSPVHLLASLFFWVFFSALIISALLPSHLLFRWKEGALSGKVLSQPDSLVIRGIFFSWLGAVVFLISVRAMFFLLAGGFVFWRIVFGLELSIVGFISVTGLAHWLLIWMDRNGWLGSPG